MVIARLMSLKIWPQFRQTVLLGFFLASINEMQTIEKRKLV
jgi:hypothetical protein